ncbi:MAG: TonB-dependent receptor [Candidatus Cryptobacteroides sp.]
MEGIFRRVLSSCILLSFLSWSVASAQNLDVTVSVSMNDVEMKAVMKAVESQTRYLFGATDIDVSRHLSINVTDEPLKNVLELMLKDTDIVYKVSGDNIFLSRKVAAKSVSGIVTGHVVDRSGQPVAGAVVMVPGTHTGVSTDNDGKFSITVPETATALEISCLGYESFVLTLGAGADYEIVLKDDANLLDEVVVVGYGQQKKSVVTAAISSVKGDQLGYVIPTRMENALKGMVSGVNVTAASGQPGESARVRVRGVGTINDSNPLYIVDGMPVTSSSYLSTADIESVEVLKDASSAAIYGSRGANGVILITTRKGSEGRCKVSYDFSYGWQNPWRQLGMLDAAGYARMVNEMNLNDGNSPVYPDPDSYGKGTDWQKEVFNRNAPIVDHQISVSGGNNRMNYYVSANYLYQEGIIGGNYNRSNYDRITVRSNNNFTLFDASKERDWLRSMHMGTNVAYAHYNSRSISSNTNRGSVLGAALSLSPMMPVYAEDPDALLAEHPTAVVDQKTGRPFAIAGDEFAAMSNPLAMLNQPGDLTKTDKLVGNLYADFEIFKNLTFKTSFGCELGLVVNDGYSIPYYLNSTRQSTTSSVWSTMTRAFTWQIENTLSYGFSVAERHNFMILAGQSAYSTGNQYVSGTSYQIRDYSQPWIDATDQDPSQRQASGSRSAYSRLASYFARLSYNFDERYMLELTYRLDGSSKFSARNKWASFPSVSAGWNITNEPFMQDVPDVLSHLKLRASWGLNGNQNIRAFGYTAMMTGGPGYQLGLEGSGVLAPGTLPQSYVNADLKWEQSEQVDAGVEVRLFRNSLSLDVDWYYKRTNGMLMSMALPGYIGNTAPYGNVGDMMNTGIEFDISYKTYVKGVGITVGANASYNVNRLVKLGNETGTQNYDDVHGLGTVSRAENGEPFPFFYGWKTAGIFQSSQEVAAYVNDKGEMLQPDAVAGDVIFVDYNKDGKIDDEDRTKIGKGMPDWTIGFNLAVEWKGIDLSAFFYSTVGNDIYDATRRNDYPLVNMQSYMMDRWCGPGTSNTIPRLTSKANGGPNRNYRSSDLNVHDGSFLRLRSLQLGYTLPKKISTKFFVQNLRVYVGAENLFTLTKYHGFDPEISSGGTSLGIDKGVYPQPRVFTVGFNITF